MFLVLRRTCVCSEEAEKRNRVESCVCVYRNVYFDRYIENAAILEFCRRWQAHTSVECFVHYPSVTMAL